MTRKTLWLSMLASGVATAVAVREARRRAAAIRLRRLDADPAWRDDDIVTEASDESFPASDPPSTTPLVGSRPHPLGT